MKTTARIVFLSTLLALCSSAQDLSIHFSGQAFKGETFRREIAGGLIFALSPRAISPGAIEGWVIRVSPQGDHPSECNDFVWVVTPPYRSYNPRYLDTSYGTTAEDAVKISPRDFNFVLNCSDYKQEEEWADRLLWPYSYSEAQVQEAENRLGSLPQGKGRLWIRDSKISPAQKEAENKNLGQIDWISFDVEIQAPKP